MEVKRVLEELLLPSGKRYFIVLAAAAPAVLQEKEAVLFLPAPDIRVQELEIAPFAKISSHACHGIRVLPVFLQRAEVRGCAPSKEKRARLVRVSIKRAFGKYGRCGIVRKKEKCRKIIWRSTAKLQKNAGLLTSIDCNHIPPCEKRKRKNVVVRLLAGKGAPELLLERIAPLERLFNCEYGYFALCFRAHADFSLAWLEARNFRLTAPLLKERHCRKPHAEEPRWLY